MKWSEAQLTALGMNTVITAVLVVTIGLPATVFAGGDFGLGQLVPGRYLNEVRQGSVDKLPEIEGAAEAPSSDLKSFKAPVASSAPAKPASVPAVNNENFYSVSVPVTAPATRPTSVAAPATRWLAYAPIGTESSPKSPSPASNSGSVPVVGGQVGAGSVPVLGLGSKFVAGSIGDAKGAEQATGLGAGWGSDGTRTSPDSSQPDLTKFLQEGSAPSPKQGAADRLLASVQEPAEDTSKDSAAELAQQMDQNLKGESYRSLSSVLSFQEIPRGAVGGTAQPKELWANPDPSTRIKLSKEAANTLHSKETIGQASAAYRRTPGGAVEGSVPGLNGARGSRTGEAGGLGQAGGIYSASAPEASAAGGTPAAVPFQFPFPIPGTAGSTSVADP